MNTIEVVTSVQLTKLRYNYSMSGAPLLRPADPNAEKET